MLFAGTCAANASIQYLYVSSRYVRGRYKAPGYKAPSDFINYIYYAYLPIIYEFLSDISNFLRHTQIINNICRVRKKEEYAVRLSENL